jgi:hypothetical protein
MAHPKPRLDLSAIAPETIGELHRQAEACLDGTVQVALAADMRATTLAGIFGGGSVALLAGAATIVASGAYDKFHPLLVSALIVAGAWFVAAMLCAWAGRPSNFHLGGYEPRLFEKSATDVTWMLRYATEDMQARIDSNRSALERNAKVLRIGFYFAVFGVLASAALFLSTV